MFHGAAIGVDDTSPVDGAAGDGGGEVAVFDGAAGVVLIADATHAVGGFDDGHLGGYLAAFDDAAAVVGQTDATHRAEGGAEARRGVAALDGAVVLEADAGDAFTEVVDLRLGGLVGDVTVADGASVGSAEGGVVDGIFGGDADVGFHVETFNDSQGTDVFEERVGAVVGDAG